ncbi:MAG: 2-C-methyl-D-erythritol 4-phosphate cytidylyltransferase [Clostridia bacterium]|nr:2-C-methyl-D-erythritol 4-phosphate cytidylyltransferase [Clostridia bacterium]
MIGMVILAAGTGKRMGASGNKLFLPLAGQPVLSLTLRHAARVLPGAPMMLVCRSGEEELARQAVVTAGLDEASVIITEGGPERQDSVRLALAAMPSAWDQVLIHDGARPILREELVQRLTGGLLQAPAVVPALPVTDTVKRVDGQGYILETVPRADLRRVQTPQAFEVSLLRQCHARAVPEGQEVTDDAALLEAYGERVLTVAGDPYNIKVTVPTDLPLADLYLKECGLCESD